MIPSLVPRDSHVQPAAGGFKVYPDSSTRDVLKQFVKESKENVPWNFTFVGNAREARAFVQRLRTMMSRIRQNLLDQGRAPARFSVRSGVVQHPIEQGCMQVILTRTQRFSGSSASLAELERLFERKD